MSLCVFSWRCFLSRKPRAPLCARLAVPTLDGHTLARRTPIGVARLTVGTYLEFVNRSRSEIVDEHRRAGVRSLARGRLHSSAGRRKGNVRHLIVPRLRHTRESQDELARLPLLDRVDLRCLKRSEERRV